MVRVEFQLFGGILVGGYGVTQVTMFEEGGQIRNILRRNILLRNILSRNILPRNTPVTMFEGGGQRQACFLLPSHPHPAPAPASCFSCSSCSSCQPSPPDAPQGRHPPALTDSCLFSDLLLCQQSFLTASSKGVHYMSSWRHIQVRQLSMNHCWHISFCTDTCTS